MKLGRKDGMTFRDLQLERHFEKVVSHNSSFPSELLPVLGLLDAWQRFHLLEGDDSPRTREALDLLLSSELRPALRIWYSRFGNDMNPAAREFRHGLGSWRGRNLEEGYLPDVDLENQAS